MKKVVYSFSLLLLAGILFISCDKEDTKETPPPTIEFKSGLQTGSGLTYINKDTTLTAGITFVIGITANTVSGENLKRLLIKGVYENVENREIIDTSFNSSSISYDKLIIAYPAIEGGTEDFFFTVWDKYDKSTIISFTITTVPPASNITTYNDIILGSQDNLQDGSFFASYDGTVYFLADGKTNYDKVDFLYYYGDSNLATLAAPDDVDAGTIYDNATNGLQTWTDRNPTRFKTTTYSSTDFNAVASSFQIVAIAADPAPNESDATDLEVGDVLAFRTVDDMYGLIRIDAITTTGTFPSIEITVKIQ